MTASEQPRPDLRSAVERHPGIPVVVVGAGPAGLAAAAQAQARGLSVVVLEAGGGAGAAVREWSHVRLFSPWSELVDPVAEELLTEHGWTSPDPASYPTGADWVEQYLAPLAAVLADRPGVDLRFGHRVIGVARTGRDRLVAIDRGEVPFTVHVQTSEGRGQVTAAAVIDASGTWGTPNPLGADGYVAPGEAEHADRIFYGIPDLTQPEIAQRYAGQHVAVAGRGASAQNVLISLAGLAERHPRTRVSWLVRRHDTRDAFGGGDNDQLEQRGALGNAARRVVADGPVRTVTGFRTARVDAAADGSLTLVAVDGREVSGVDEVVVVTGFRPDHTWLSEVHLDLDGELSAPSALAPEIHPAYHSCGSVSPHGANLLRQPERDLYLVGMKSYGRAPSFLTLTGYEQTRSVVAEIAGDLESAERVDLVLPDSGVCGGSGRFDEQPADGGCCGPTVVPAPELITIGSGPAASV